MTPLLLPMLAIPTKPPTPPPTPLMPMSPLCGRQLSGLPPPLLARRSTLSFTDHDDQFVVATLRVFTSPAVHVYSVGGIIVDTNAEAGKAVGVDGVAMEAVQAEIADATSTPLRRAIKVQAFRPADVRWSRSQPPGDDPLPWVVDTTPIPAATLAPVCPGPNRGNVFDCVREHHAAIRPSRRPHAHDRADERDRGCTRSDCSGASVQFSIDRTAEVQRCGTGPESRTRSRHRHRRLPLSARTAIAGASGPAANAVAVADNDPAMTDAPPQPPEQREPPQDRRLASYAARASRIGALY